jgi:uncharacterized protein involved in exopolysaccharide biosynthesis
MIPRPLLTLTTAALCLTFSLAAGWLWQSLSTPKFEASAKLVIANGSAADERAGKPASDDGSDAAVEVPPVDEASVLSPDVLSAAANFIAERDVRLSLASPFDSVTDYLLERIRVGRPAHATLEEILITCSATDGQEALQMLSAVVDACLETATSALRCGAACKIDEQQTIELQMECDQLAGAIEQQQQIILEMAAQLEVVRAAAASAIDNDPIPLEAELVHARRVLGDATVSLADARRDAENRLPAEFIAARIADVPARTRVLERLNLAKIRNELDQQEALRQKCSAIYGRNHPRMAELRQHIESLEQQVSVFSAGERDQPADATGASGAAIVLAALENETVVLKAAEQELQTRLAAAQQRSHQQHELETQLSASRQDLEFLLGDHDRICKQIDGSLRNQASHLAWLIEPPALSPDPIAPQAGLQLAVACVSGMALCLVVIWQLRSLSRISAAKPAAPAKNRAAGGYSRFRSRTEEQLIRLKLQSAH